MKHLTKFYSMRLLITSLILITIAFSARGQFQLNGVATDLGGSIYQLTPASNSQFGAIWYKLQHNLDNPFNVQGQFNFGSDPGGADGIAFVMQNSCLSAGGSGGGLGYSGISGQSIAIEFDTYQNIAGTGTELNNDPVYDHIAVEKSGDVVHDVANPNDLYGPVQIDPVLSNVKTGAWYDFQINYDPATKLLTVYFNGSLRVSMTYDIKATIFGGNQWVYWGFTASTGGHNNVQQIYIDKSVSSLLLQDVSICGGSVSISLDPLTSLRGSNIALNNPVVASSSTGSVSEVVDGNMGTRWESVWGVDPQWVYVDLQSPTDLDSVVLYWEGAYATEYKIQTSTDAVTWTDVYHELASDGGKDKIMVSASKVRYVRVYGMQRSLSAYGYSLWEFQVYGQPLYLWSPNDGTVSDINSSTVTITPLTTTTYSVLIPDPCIGFTTSSFTITQDCPNPVVLIDFTAKAENKSVHLQWSTETELNSNYFEILKSSDGIHFKVIGYVNASGNSSKLNNYNFYDNEIFSGDSYYKLKIVDMDGSSEESPVRVVRKKSANPFIAVPVFENETNIIIPEGIDWIEYSIVDMLGQTLSTTLLNNPGSSISLGNQLSPACYLIIIKTEDTLSTVKINKIK